MFELRKTGDWDTFRARGKRNSPGAAARHSQSARAYWDNHNFVFVWVVIHPFPQISPKSSTTTKFIIPPDFRDWSVPTASRRADK